MTPDSSQGDEQSRPIASVDLRPMKTWQAAVAAPLADAGRVLVVSHPAVLAVNQLPYQVLQRRGWDVRVVTPARWRHEYAAGSFARGSLAGFEDRVVSRRVLNQGSVQRHVYVAWISRLIREFRPQVAFVEAEPTSLAGLQWAMALWRAGVPFGLQFAENLDRSQHPVARANRHWTMSRAAFLAVRSPAAARLARDLGAAIPTPLVPHPVPDWTPVAKGRTTQFTVGFAGRLVPEKGLRDLVAAMQEVPRSRLLLVGNGPMADELGAASIPGGSVEIITDIPHTRMPEAYAMFDVLALPSHTTPTWAEQFGRVLVEALACEVPVIGSSSGEIPWVINATGGGLVVPEGDVAALRDAILRLRDDHSLRRHLGTAGRISVERSFSLSASTAVLSAALANAADRVQADPDADRVQVRR
jgi:glycosyltransferase involved in cell wall biosynthesis